MRQKTILDKILSVNNMNEAFKKVKRNKGAAGADNLTIEEAEEYIRGHHGEFLRQIRQRQYTPQPVLRVEIPKASGGVRLLGIPTVVDRVIQQAIAQVLTPIFEEIFHENSYGFRPGKNGQMAVLKSLEHINEGYQWLVDIDLEKFFDTVNHDRLMNLVAHQVTDGDVISLIRKYLVSGVMVAGNFEETTIGTPQGGNLSPLLSNIMLNELDQELDKRGLRFVRYADDCLIFVKSEFSARRVMRSVTRYIEKDLGLKVNATKSKVTKPEDPDVKYLGFAYYRERETGEYKVKPHALSIERFQNKLRQTSKKNWSIDMGTRIRKLNRIIYGWVNYFKIGAMKKVLTKISGNLRYRLRMCIWTQWKTGKNRVKSLIKLGMNKYHAYKNGHSSKGAARIATSWVMTTTVTNRVLAVKGLVSPDTYYLQQAHVI